ncbi:MAG TPA: aminotransferase class V-fold PLP-dependent enzyme [Planctomycetes bacterium]|nr:aminotransferase class V-fold PLP-dependent enzyme [Planctomycetota bacterium]HIL37955.1 aminotransferase class V-fold PLP-dependent enzyme [Planctomycetota bacterium]
MEEIQTSDPVSLRGHWILDPEVHFLNHGSYGACPSAVLDEQRSWRDRIERQPVAFFGLELRNHLDEAREKLASFLGCDGSGLVFVPNVTTGVNAVLRSLEFGPGDEILITNHGYNACNNAAQFVCDRSGATIVRASLPFPCRGPDEAFEAILAAATDNTRLALVDHITSPTGMLLPIARIVQALQGRGIDVMVDGAHAPGQVPLDLDALGAAYYAGNCHKWLCTPKGSGLLHVRSDRRDRVRPTTISHGANTARSGHTRLQDEFDWPGTIDPTPWLCVPFAIEFLGGLLPGGWDEIRAQNHRLALAARTRLSEALGVEPPLPTEMIANMTAFPLPAAEDDAPRGAFSCDPLQARLIETHRVEIPISSWPAPPERVLRVSAQLYNDEQDLEALILGLEAEGLTC